MTACKAVHNVNKINKILKQQQQQHHNNQYNLNPSQCRALTQLKQDNSRVVLTADKGVAMVIIDQEDYTKPKPYYKTPTPTKYSQRIPPANLKQTHFPSQGHQTNRRPQHQ